MNDMIYNIYLLQSGDTMLLASIEQIYPSNTKLVVSYGLILNTPAHVTSLVEYVFLGYPGSMTL